MKARHELTPTGARQLFKATSFTHPLNLMAGQGPGFVMRGGIRL